MRKRFDGATKSSRTRPNPEHQNVIAVSEALLSLCAPGPNADFPARVFRTLRRCLSFQAFTASRLFSYFSDAADTVNQGKASEQPLTLRGSEYAQAVQELNKVIDRAEGMLQ